MAEQHGHAGKSAVKMGDRRRNTILFAGIAAFILIIAIYLILTNPANFKTLGPLGLVLMILLMVIPDLFDKFTTRKSKESKRAYRGARGEEVVAAVLENLDENYCIYHDVESPYGNIDHIVVSRAHGIFLIETKAHGGKAAVVDGQLLVNGKTPEKDFINQALKNAFWLRDTLAKLIGEKPWITPLVVFTNAFVTNAQPIKGVRIINKKYLLEILQRDSRPNPANQHLWEQRETLKTLIHE